MYVSQTNLAFTADYLYTGAIGGSWVKQSTRNIARVRALPGQSAGYAVSPTTNVIYFFSGLKLYALPYTIAGGGPDTLVKDFTGILTAPSVSAWDSFTSHSLIIVNGNQIYRYTDAVNIN